MSHDLAPHLLPAFFLIRKLYFGLSESRFRPKPTSRSFINLTKAEWKRAVMVTVANRRMRSQAVIHTKQLVSCFHFRGSSGRTGSMRSSVHKKCVFDVQICTVLICLRSLSWSWAQRRAAWHRYPCHKGSNPCNLNQDSRLVFESARTVQGRKLRTTVEHILYV